MIQRNLAMGNTFNQSVIYVIYNEKHLRCDWKYETYTRLHFHFYYCAFMLSNCRDFNIEGATSLTLA